VSRDDLMRPTEVAELFGVDPKTVTRWGRAGKLPSIRTPGGHRRYPREAVMALLRGEPDGAVSVDGRQGPALQVE
jgi:excisionase family DNA binding protein